MIISDGSKISANGYSGDSSKICPKCKRFGTGGSVIISTRVLNFEDLAQSKTTSPRITSEGSDIKDITGAYFGGGGRLYLRIRDQVKIPAKAKLSKNRILNLINAEVGYEDLLGYLSVRGYGTPNN